MTAKANIDDLLKDNKSEEAIQLSTKYQVPCKLTSFFAAIRLMGSTINTYKYKKRNLKSVNLPDLDINIYIQDDEEYTINCKSKFTTISEIKCDLRDILDIPVSQQKLIYEGRVLKNQEKLSDLKIQNGHTLNLI